MADKCEATNGFDPLVQPYVDFWSNYIKQANDSTRELLDGFSSASDAKAWQRRWFETVSKSMDAYLRSPDFLQAMKQHTDLLVKAKRQGDDLATEIARNANIPTAGDISGLFERLHSVEEVIVGRLGRLEERLNAIENKVGVGAPAGVL